MLRKRFSHCAVCRKNWHWPPERATSAFLFLESYRSLSRLADVLWTADESYARQLFAEALKLSVPDSKASAQDAQAILRLRREVIVAISKRDTNWGKRLIDADAETNVAERTKADTFTAFGLLRAESDKATEFVERTLRGGVPPDIHALLLVLRHRDQAAADTLFLRTLGQLASQSEVDASALLAVGTYVFTSPTFDHNDPSLPPDITRVVGVGRLLVYDITADRPGIPPALVRAYLESAATILSRAVADPTGRTHYYVAARLLVPKAMKFAPHLTHVFGAAMQRLTPDVPTDLTLDSSYANFKADSFRDLDETLRDVEKDSNKQRREARYLSLVADLWRRSELADARLVSAKIADSEARNSLATLIDFKEIVNELDSKKPLQEIEERASKLPLGVEKALTWLGIASEYAERGDWGRTTDAINASLKAADSISGAHRPFLMLAAAGQLGRYDQARAQATLTEAIRQLNAQKPEALRELNWEQRVEAGPLWRDFPLRIENEISSPSKQNFFVPEGHLTIAQRFIHWYLHKFRQVVFSHEVAIFNSPAHRAGSQVRFSSKP